MAPIMFQIGNATNKARERLNDTRIGTEVKGGQGRIVRATPPVSGRGAHHIEPLSQFMNVAELPAALDAL